MKKLMCAVAALSAGICMADVESANIVGYNNVALPAGETIILAVQFTDVATPQTIAIKDLATMPEADRKGSNAIGTGADQMWVWDATGGAWVKYFYRKQGTKVIGWCKEKTTDETADTVVSGQGVFFKRAATGGATTLTLAGGVAQMDAALTVEIPAGATKIVSNPWPIELAVANLSNYIPEADQKGSNAIGTGADQAWVWLDSNWTKYFFRKQGTKVIGWCKEKTTDVTTDKIAPGQGFFFKRAATGGATTITFPKPM